MSGRSQFPVGFQTELDDLAHQAVWQRALALLPPAHIHAWGQVHRVISPSRRREPCV
jgi:hypothetical protein